MIYDLVFKEDVHQRLPVRLCNFGIRHIQEPVQRPNGMSVHQWFYCVKGRGEMILNGQKCILHEKECALILAGEPHAYHALTKTWQVHFIGFDGPDSMAMMKSLRMWESGVYYLSDRSIFSDHLKMIRHIYNSSLPHKERELSKACYDFLLDISFGINRISMVVPSVENDVIREMIEYMEEHYQTAFSLDELAAHVQRSKEYLCTLFKKNMEQTVIHYLTNLRIVHARIYLGQYPEKKVWEIAQMCGFDSPSYFGKKFKEEVGMTPDEYRSKR